MSQGYFDEKDTEKELYTAFIELLKGDGHITEPEALASFEFALSVRSAAPRIEAHYQFYRTSVEPSLLAEQTKACEIWVSFNGKQFCSPHLEEPFGDIQSERYGVWELFQEGMLIWIGHMNSRSTVYSAIALICPRSYMPILLPPASRSGIGR